MQAYASERKNYWTREEAEDYQKFESLLALFEFFFQWADSPSTISIVGLIADELTAEALEWRVMIEDEGETSRLSQWEREIGKSSESSFPTELIVSSIVV